MRVAGWLRSLFVRTPAGLGEQLRGAWLLVRAGGQPPPVMEHKVAFQGDGTWRFESRVAASGEASDGFFVAHGGGEWRVDGGMLRYTAGDTSGECSVEIRDGLLVLGKDPVLQLKHVVDKTSEYQRSAD